MGSHGPAVLAREPRKLLVELHSLNSGALVTAFVQAVQSFELLGVRRFRRLKDGVTVDYDARALEVQDLRPILMTPLSQVSYGLGDYFPSTKVPPVTFGGSQGPDQSMACVLLDTPEWTLIRRVFRIKHTVRTSAVPGASAHIEIPWAADWHQSAPAGRPGRVVSLGSLTRSPLGVTVTSCSSFTDELVMGRVGEAFLKNPSGIRRGIRCGCERGPATYLTVVSYH